MKGKIMKDLVQRLTDALEQMMGAFYPDGQAKPERRALIAEARAALGTQVAVPFNPSAECSPTATQCPRCNNPHNACDRALAAPATEPTIDGSSFHDIKKIYKAIIAVGSGK